MRDGLRVLSLFSGIGGFDLGLERAGMTIVGQVEIGPYCLKVLEKHWPNVKRMKDIHDVRGDEFGAVDLVCGGPPCQPISNAGERKGADDARWLWPEFLRLVRVIRPQYALMENPPALLHRRFGFGGILGELAACGYDTEWDCLPAAAFGAPHLRDRLWLLAYRDGGSGSPQREQQQAQRAAVARGSGERYVADAQGDGRQPRRAGNAAQVAKRRQPHRGRQSASLADADESRSQGRSGTALPRRGIAVGHAGRSDWWRVEPDVGRVAHGIPQRVDRLRGLGNAVVPQIVEYLGRRILELDR